MNVTRYTSSGLPTIPIKPNPPTIPAVNTPTVVIEPVSVPVTVKPQQQLLGVNGTGQRHDPILPVTTEKPTLVSDPINTADKDTYDMSDINDQVDVPSNETADALEASKRNYTITLKDVSLTNTTI